MGQITCEGKVSGLRFELRDTIYNITGFSDCSSSREIGCYFRRNIMSIRNDSLIIGYGKDKNEKPISCTKDCEPQIATCNETPPTEWIMSSIL